MKKADRCDRCGAQAHALVRSIRTGGELMFCEHHFREAWDKLIADEWDVVEHTPVQELSNA